MELHWSLRKYSTWTWLHSCSVVSSFCICWRRRQGSFATITKWGRCDVCSRQSWIAIVCYGKALVTHRSPQCVKGHNVYSDHLRPCHLRVASTCVSAVMLHAPSCASNSFFVGKLWHCFGVSDLREWVHQKTDAHMRAHTLACCFTHVHTHIGRSLRTVRVLMHASIGRFASYVGHNHLPLHHRPMSHTQKMHLCNCFAHIQVT